MPPQQKRKEQVRTFISESVEWDMILKVSGVWMRRSYWSTELPTIQM